MNGHTMIAERLVNELMLVSVLVAGEGATALAESLEQQGASATAFAEDQPYDGFDLAILLADPAAAGQAGTRALVSRLSSASERLLLAPLPLGPVEPGGTPALPQLADWFEVFAEFGYQPVVEFDASFVSPGAFLVDRAAIADEGDLSAFSDRLQLGAPPPDERRARPPEAKESADGPAARLAAAETALAAARTAEAALTEALAASRAEVGALHAQATALERQQAHSLRALHEMQSANAGWDGLRQWARAVVADPARDTPPALARDLPQLNAWRSPSPPIALPTPDARRFWPALRRLTRRRTTPPAILTDTALVRASRLFDAAWYVAATPELADSTVDPAFHYVLVGTLRGADPGPWFDTQAYLAAHPEVAGTGLNALVHAIRIGADREINSG